MALNYSSLSSGDHVRLCACSSVANQRWKRWQLGHSNPQPRPGFKPSSSFVIAHNASCVDGRSSNRRDSNSPKVESQCSAVNSTSPWGFGTGFSSM